MKEGRFFLSGAMAGESLRRNITLALSFLVGLDVFLASWAFFLPGAWFRFFHGVPLDDPQGFLRRCGGAWAAFALFQALALVRWKKAPHWLVLVAGIRFSDIFTDWVYLALARDMTLPGAACLFAAGPANLFFGLFLMAAYARLGKEAGGAREKWKF